jgi:hypothetical protein
MCSKKWGVVQQDFSEDTEPKLYGVTALRLTTEVTLAVRADK